MSIVANPSSDFVSFSMLDHHYFNVYPQSWHLTQLVNVEIWADHILWALTETHLFHTVPLKHIFSTESWSSKTFPMRFYFKLTVNVPLLESRNSRKAIRTFEWNKCILPFYQYFVLSCKSEIILKMIWFLAILISHQRFESKVQDTWSEKVFLEKLQLFILNRNCFYLTLKNNSDLASFNTHAHACWNPLNLLLGTPNWSQNCIWIMLVLLILTSWQ